MSTQHHAPDAAAMRQACLAARRHLLLRPTDPEVTMSVAPVPHFVPGMGLSGEWYRVGALQLVSTDRSLTVYLDAVTRQVQVEQVLMQVDDHPRSIRPDHVRRRSDLLAQDRWENEGGTS